ncbi:MAG: S8 family serine peptidase [Candidatus Thorarchaeota archaeon]
MTTPLLAPIPPANNPSSGLNPSDSPITYEESGSRFDNKPLQPTKSPTTTVLEDGSIIQSLKSISEESGLSISTEDGVKLIKVTDGKLRVTVGFHLFYEFSQSSYDSHLANTNAEFIRELKELNGIVVEVPISSLAMFQEYWQNLAPVRYTEVAQITSISAISTDPDWSLQYGPQIIQADLAWDIQIGDPASILVAVIDTGIDYNHPDLVDQYVAGGYDYVNDDTDPMDDHSHGTHCAGIITATINNSVGIAGVANVSIMGYKVFNSLGYGYDYDAASAIINATDAGATVLSNSYGFPTTSTALEDAVAYAAANDVVVVVSAGNSGAPVSSYPALYPETIAVSATDDTDTPASFTSYGPAVDVAAPGVTIWSTVPVSMGSYGYKSGTSMAGPHVAAVSALIRAEFPGYSADQVRQHLRNTADDLGPVGWDDYYGYGRINAYKAVQPPPDHELVTYLLGAPMNQLPGESINLTVIVFNFGQNLESNVELQLWIDNASVKTQTFTSLTFGDNGTFKHTWTPIAEGVHNITAYTLPVLGETFLANNRVTKMVDVSFPIITYNLGDYIHLDEVGVGLYANFTYEYDIDPTHVRVGLGDGYSWLSVNTLNRLIEGGTKSSWDGTNYMGQIETDIGPNSTIDWFSTTGSVNGTAFYDWNGMMLEAWNVTIAWGDTYAYYHKETGIWLYYKEWTGLEVHMVNTSMIVWQPPEHDLQTSLETPGLLPPGNTTIINASVYNGGASNETDIELQLWINNNMVANQIYPSLLSGTEETFSYPWTPMAEGSYNITTYALPVVNESRVFNNRQTRIMQVQIPGQYLILQDAYPWNYNWTVILESNGIAFNVLESQFFGSTNLSFYQRVIIPSDQPQSYYDALSLHLGWLEAYSQAGGIVEIHAADRGSNSGTWSGTLPLGIIYHYSIQNIIDVEDPSNPIFFSPNIITDDELDYWGVSAHGYLSNTGGANVILSGAGLPILIETTHGQGYYLISCQTLERAYNWGYSMILENILLYNPTPAHELGTVLTTPSLLPNGTSMLINFSVINRGINDEFNVELQLWINKTQVVNQIYPTLASGASETLNYLWTPSKIGIYNVTAYAAPVTNENLVLNNYVEELVTVKVLVNYQMFEIHYKWFDAYTNGYNLNLTGDDVSEAVNIPFTFFYYDANFTTIYISSNGWLSFVDSTPWDNINPSFPNSAYPYVIAPFWEDLEAKNNTYVWNTSTFLVIEYHNYTYLGGTEVGTFEVVLFANGTIYFQFQSINLDSGATVGLNYGYEPTYYTTYPTALTGVFELALLFTGGTYERHDLNATVEAPSAIIYNETMVIQINVTVINVGSYNETDVELQLWIEDNMVLNQVFPSLLVQTEQSITYTWTPSVRGTYNITVYVIPVTNESFTKNNQLTQLVIIGDPSIDFALGDYILWNFDLGGGIYPWANFTYDHMIDPVHVYVNASILLANATEWFSVNIVTRLIEDGSIWVGSYYMGQIETDINISDPINWLDSTGIVEGTVWYEWNGAQVEAWRINLDDLLPGTYCYYHKATGVWLYMWDPQLPSEIFIVDTSLIVPLPPTVLVTYPNGGELVKGTITITWIANDPDNGSLTFSVYYWNGTAWIALASSITTTFFNWNTSSLIDGDFYKIRVIVHDGKFQSEDDSNTPFMIDNAADPPTIQLTYPNGGETLSGTVTITWSASDPNGDELVYILYYWNGNRWVLIKTGITTSSYDWDTTSRPNGTFYRIKVMTSDSLFTVEDESDAPFRLENPHAPLIAVTSPNGGETVSGTVTITWTASDQDANPLTFELYYWDGATWKEITSGISTTTYVWDTTNVLDGDFYQIKVIVSDGALENEDISDGSFTIDNDGQVITNPSTPTTPSTSASPSSTTTTTSTSGFEPFLILIALLSLEMISIARRKE